MADAPENAVSSSGGLMDVDSIPEGAADKITLLKGYAPDFSAATFCLKNEDHTLGNALRYILMKDPNVEFCGYSIPHPSEDKIHLRIQMYNNISALSALRSALHNLEDLFLAVDSAYEENLNDNKFERFEEDTIDLQQLRRRDEEKRKSHRGGK